jgi:hypothetical protein
VYAWGRGEHGRLGFGDDKSSHMVPLKVQLLAGEDIVQVIDFDYSCDVDFSCFSLDDEQFYLQVEHEVIFYLL